MVRPSGCPRDHARTTTHTAYGVKRKAAYSQMVRMRRFSHSPGEAMLAATAARFRPWYTRSRGWIGQDRNGKRNAT